MTKYHSVFSKEGMQLDYKQYKEKKAWQACQKNIDEDE